MAKVFFGASMLLLALLVQADLPNVDSIIPLTVFGHTADSNCSVPMANQSSGFIDCLKDYCTCTRNLWIENMDQGDDDEDFDMESWKEGITKLHPNCVLDHTQSARDLDCGARRMCFVYYERCVRKLDSGCRRYTNTVCPVAAGQEECPEDEFCRPQPEYNWTLIGGLIITSVLLRLVNAKNLVALEEKKVLNQCRKDLFGEAAERKYNADQQPPETTEETSLAWLKQALDDEGGADRDDALVVTSVAKQALEDPAVQALLPGLMSGDPETWKEAKANSKIQPLLRFLASKQKAAGPPKDAVAKKED